MAASPSFPFTYALVGAGRVGTAVAALLERSGNNPIAVASRDPVSAARAATLLGASAVDISEVPEVDVALIGASEVAVPEIAERLSGRAQVFIHFAGAYGIAPLETVVRGGAWACALHPVQACPDVETAIVRLPGSSWGVTTTWPAARWAQTLVTDHLQGTPVEVSEDARPLWHAAAVSTSNGIAALMAIGERLLAEIGIAEPEKVLGPLARGTVDNAVEGGGGAATLTGPAIRGESTTIARHLDALRADAPHLVEAYVLAARVILAAGPVDPETVISIESLLEDAR